MKNNFKAILIVFSITLLCMLAITFYMAFEINKTRIKNTYTRTWVKEKKTGLVTVMDNQENILCTFYDSVGGIGCQCPDTIKVYPSSK